METKDLIDSFIDDAKDAGYFLNACAAIADERRTSLTITRSPQGAWVISHGEPLRYLAEDLDLSMALRKAHAVFEPWLESRPAVDAVDPSVTNSGKPTTREKCSSCSSFAEEIAKVVEEMRQMTAKARLHVPHVVGCNHIDKWADRLARLTPRQREGQ